MESLETLLAIIPYIGPSSLLIAVIIYFWVLKQPAGDQKISKVATLIEVGAMTFLKREYSVLMTFLVCVTSFLAWKLGIYLAVCYVFGVLSSMLCGHIGIKASTKANVRTAVAAAHANPKRAFTIAFMGGSVMGITVASTGLIAITLTYLFLSGRGVLEALNGLAMGAGTMAFFARVGGGIYTKASDMSADLVGKIEKEIPEDDPRNPATIADNVGDNIGDTVGIGSDFFESYIASVAATIFIGASYSDMTSEVVLLPILVIGMGLIASLVGILSIHLLKIFFKSEISLRIAPFISLIILFLGSFWAVYEMNFTIFNFAMGPFYAILLGVGAGLLLGFSTEFYTSFEYSPVKRIIRAGNTGAATSILSGLSTGMYSCIAAVVIISLSIYFANYFAGLYGIGIASVGMLATIGTTMTFAAMGPIADNASGIAAMGALGINVRHITEDLDAIGNKAATFGKGLSQASITLTVLAIFSAYASAVGLSSINMMNSQVIIGLFLGATLPFYIGASTIRSVGVTASKMVDEIRKQFKKSSEQNLKTQNTDMLTNSKNCIVIATRSSLKRMIVPGIVTVCMPLLTGFLLGKEALGGLLMGGIITGILLSIFMTNAGRAWDSAKKMVEHDTQIQEQKTRAQKKAYKALIVGDAIGDPFKDTSGPAINILIKLMSIIALVIAPLLS